MIIYKLRNIGDLSVGQRSLQAVYVVKEGARLVWERIKSLSAWFRSEGWFRSEPW